MIYKIQESPIDEFKFVINGELHFTIIDFEEELVVDYNCPYLTKMEVSEIMTELVENILRAAQNGSFQL
jgi:hypothetical protein